MLSICFEDLQLVLLCFRREGDRHCGDTGAHSRPARVDGAHARAVRVCVGVRGGGSAQRPQNAARTCQRHLTLCACFADDDLLLDPDDSALEENNIKRIPLLLSVVFISLLVESVSFAGCLSIPLLWSQNVFTVGRLFEVLRDVSLLCVHCSPCAIAERVCLE